MKKNKKIFVIIFLSLLLIVIYMLVDKKNLLNAEMESTHKIDIPKIILPLKSIEFSIVRNRGGNIDFSGFFSEERTPMQFVELLGSVEFKHKIHIDKKLTQNEEVVLLTKKLIKIFLERDIEGSIIYKSRKLLIMGNVRDSQDKKRIETALALSVVNSFSVIKIIEMQEALDVISSLEAIVDIKDESIDKDNTPTSDEVEDILSNLKTIALPETKKEKKFIRKVEKNIKVKKVEKKVIPKVIKQVKKASPPIESKPIIKIDKKSEEIEKIEMVDLDEVEKYRMSLKKGMPDKDIMSLPTVEKVDMDIEKKISRGDATPLTTRKPFVNEETIYIPSNENKIDSDIPWANLQEVDKEVNGILLDESIN